MEDSPAGADEPDLGESSLALDSTFDRPVAAAVGVGDGAINRELWVFVCDAENVLKRRKKSGWNGTWGNWQTVTSTPCAGVPTVGAGQALPWDDVEVFFRSTSNKLIEIYYRPNGTTIERDLSTTRSLGDINGNPIITDMGTNGYFSVAYRRKPSNWLMTLKYIPGTKPQSGWTVENTVADNGVGKGHGQLTAIYTPTQTYLAAAYYDSWRIYSRSSSFEPYTQVMGPFDNLPKVSVITFAPASANSMLAITRGWIGEVRQSPIVPNGSLAFDLAEAVPVAAAPYLAGSWNYPEAAHVRNDRGAVGCSYTNGQCAIFGIHDAGTSEEDRLPGQLSAGSRPTNASASMDSYVFWSDSVNHLYMADLKNPATSGAVDMGILTLPP